MKHPLSIVSAGLMMVASNSVLALDIATIDSDQASQCLLISEESCSGTSEAKCLEEHKEQAQELRADSVLITDVSESRYRKPSLAGGIKSVTKITVDAEYYDCAVRNTASEKAPISGRSPSTPAQQSITERLRVLKTLRDDELISEQEYKDKKSAILKQL